MLADVDRGAGLKVEREDVARAVAAEGNAAGAACAGQEEGQAGEHALERALERAELNGDAGVLPEEDVMLEIDGDGAQLDVEDGDEFAFDVVGDAAEGFILGDGGKERGDGHGGRGMGNAGFKIRETKDTQGNQLEPGMADWSVGALFVAAVGMSSAGAAAQMQGEEAADEGGREGCDSDEGEEHGREFRMKSEKQPSPWQVGEYRDLGRTRSIVAKLSSPLWAERYNYILASQNQPSSKYPNRHLELQVFSHSTFPILPLHVPAIEMSCPIERSASFRISPALVNMHCTENISSFESNAT